MSKDVWSERVVAAIARERELTRRETAVLAAAAQGKRTKEIAVQLGVSGKTVDYFWARIYAKLGCASRVEVLALLLRLASRQAPHWVD